MSQNAQIIMAVGSGNVACDAAGSENNLAASVQTTLRDVSEPIGSGDARASRDCLCSSPLPMKSICIRRKCGERKR